MCHSFCPKKFTKCAKRSKNRAFPKISDKRSSISDVKSSTSYVVIGKKNCFRFELPARAAGKLGRNFLLKHIIRASWTANLTEYIYLLND